MLTVCTSVHLKIWVPHNNLLHAILYNADNEINENTVEEKWLNGLKADDSKMDKIQEESEVNAWSRRYQVY